MEDRDGLWEWDEVGYVLVRLASRPGGGGVGGLEKKEGSLMIPIIHGKD